MSKNLKNVATVEVPEKALNRLLEITDGLVRMHLELIRLYEQESYLKKHHKAYLHVRDHAEAVCESDKHTISEMLESLHPDKLFAEEDDRDDVMDVFDPKKCVDCPCYDECDEYVNRKRVSPGSVAVVMMTTETLGQMHDRSDRADRPADRYLSQHGCRRLYQSGSVGDCACRRI